MIITVGINDCTFRRRPGGKFSFTFDNANDMIVHVMAHIEDIDRLIHNVHPEARVSFCDLIGMDLQIYKRCEDPKPGQQDLFNTAILEINHKIGALNKKNNILTPWIAKMVHVPKKGGYNHIYERLDDGLHWDQDLKISCAKRLVRAASKLME